MKKIFTFIFALFAISLVKAGTFGMGDYVWKDDGTQNVLSTNSSFVKNDQKPVDLEMALGMWTFFKTEGKGTIVLQYARGNANAAPFVAGSAGTTAAQSPNYALNWVTINTDSIGKDWVLAREFSSITEGDYTASGLTEYSDVGAYAGPTSTIDTHIIDFGGKAVTSNSNGITLDGTTIPGFVSGDYNYMKGVLKFAIMPGSTVLPDSVYSFRLYTTDAHWDGQNATNRGAADLTMNFNHYEGLQNEIKDRASEGNPDPNAVNDGNHFDHGMPIMATGPDILTNIGLPVKWSAPGLQTSIKNGDVILNWGTETEINNKEFIVQRSANGSNDFIKVGTVSSKSVGGYSTSPLKYSYTDKSPLAKAIYRIAEIDMDGNINYSNSVAVSLNNTSEKLSVYPNPVLSAGFLNVKGAESGSAYRIISINGLNVAKGVLNSAHRISVNHLAAGVYVLQIANDNGSTESVKFIRK